MNSAGQFAMGEEEDVDEDEVEDEVNGKEEEGDGIVLFEVALREVN